MPTPAWMMDYESVPDRLTRFFIDHPAGSVQTVVELFDQETGTALIQAHIFRTPDDPRPAIGIAMERAAHTPAEIMKEGYVEAAGTHAVGKALENLGYAKKPLPEPNGKKPTQAGKPQPKPTASPPPQQVKDLTEDEKKAMGVDALTKAAAAFSDMAPDGSGSEVFSAVLHRFQAQEIGDIYVSAIGNVDKAIRTAYHELRDSLPTKNGAEDIL